MGLLVIFRHRLVKVREEARSKLFSKEGGVQNLVSSSHFGFQERGSALGKIAFVS